MNCVASGKPDDFSIQKVQENTLPAGSCGYYKIEIITKRGKKFIHVHLLKCVSMTLLKMCLKVLA